MSQKPKLFLCLLGFASSLVAEMQYLDRPAIALLFFILAAIFVAPIYDAAYRRLS